jgi:hypothetical protein
VLASQDVETDAVVIEFLTKADPAFSKLRPQIEQELSAFDWALPCVDREAHPTIVASDGGRLRVYRLLGTSTIDIVDLGDVRGGRLRTEREALFADGGFLDRGCEFSLPNLEFGPLVFNPNVIGPDDYVKLAGLLRPHLGAGQA